MKIRKLLAFLVLCAVVFVAGCGAKGSNDSATVKSVFSEDNRQDVTSEQFPWSALGKVKADNFSCTGSLVGDDLVLTNAHCIFDAQGQLYKSIEFWPNYKNGQKTLSSRGRHFWYGTTKPSEQRHLDWALIRLASKLGERFGHFGTKILDFSKPDQMSGWFNLAGYSGDYKFGETAGVHYKCSVRAHQWDLLLHDCDTAPGSSGGPMFASWENEGARIVALNAAHLPYDDGTNPAAGTPFSLEIANMAVKADKFSAKITELRSSSAGKSATTHVHLCNKSGREKIYSALTYNQDGKWKSGGWWSIPLNECREVAVSDNYRGDVFVHANHNESKTEWGGGPYSFCINPTDVFNFLEADTQCDTAAGHKRVKFSPAFTVAPDKLNIWNFNP